MKIESANMNSNSYQLAIELSNPSSQLDTPSVAIFDDQSALVGSASVPSYIRSADALMGMIEQLCATHQVMPKMIKRVLISVGPGGYTSLRISTTTAKVLAYAVGCSVHAIPTSSVAAHSIPDHQLPAVVLLASKKKQSHASIVDTARHVRTIGVIDADQLDQLIQEFQDTNQSSNCGQTPIQSVVSDTHLPESFEAVAQTHQVQVEPLKLDARRLCKAANGTDPVDLAELAPMYAREPDAITQWRSRKQSPSS